MNGKLYIWGLALVLSALILSGCSSDTGEATEVVVTDDATDVTPFDQAHGTPEVAVDAQFATARNTALAFVSGRYGEQAPPAGLAWTTERTTPEGLVGSESFQYTAEGWVVAVSCPVVAPEAVVCQVTATDQASGFQWEGKVDAAGQVTELTGPPVSAPDPARARDAALVYLSANYGEQAPPPDLTWTEANVTPEGLVGVSTFQYSAHAERGAGDWLVTVSFPLAAPDATLYQVVVANQASGQQWEGEVDAAGQVIHLEIVEPPVPTPTPSGGTEAVDDWWGEVVSNPPGSQFDDYFQRQIVNGDQYGIESLDPDVQAQIVDLRDTGTTVHVWGTLHHDVPDYNAAQIQVTRLEVQEVPGPYPITEESVEGWIGTIVKYPILFQLDDYFERDDGEQYGIAALDTAIQEQVETLRCTGAQLQVWGRLLVGALDAENRQIQVERIEDLSGPATESRNLAVFATPSASSVLSADLWGTYEAFSAIDSSLSTPWTEDVDGPGTGEWIMLTFPSAIEMHSIGVDVGYDRDEGDTFHSADLFDKNNRLKRATLIFSDGEQVELTFEDARGIQMLPLARAPLSIQTTFIKVVIEEVYPGSTFDDTCVAEIEVWGKTK